jgi:ABC-2 type transport system ATP-binding protein
MHVLARGLKRAHRGVDALDAVTIELKPGQITAVLGANGAGKSTLLRIIALVEAPGGGELLMDGRNALPQPGTFRDAIGYVPQDIALFEELTARENLLCWARGKATAGTLDALIDSLGMAQFASKRVSALSGGMKRRVNLAVALLNHPRLLVLDEPFVGMDTDQRSIVVRVLRSLSAQGVTQIISSHQPEVFRHLAEHVLVLEHGHVAYNGPMKDSFLAEPMPPDA